MTQRIQFLISRLGLSTRAFAIKCGLRQNTLSNQLNGVRDLSLSTVSAILITFPEVSSEWLLRGSGDMFTKQIDEEIEAGYIKQTERIEKLIGTIETLQETIELKNKVIVMLNEEIKQLKACIK